MMMMMMPSTHTLSGVMAAHHLSSSTSKHADIPPNTSFTSTESSLPSSSILSPSSSASYLNLQSHTFEADDRGLTSWPFTATKDSQVVWKIAHLRKNMLRSIGYLPPSIRVLEASGNSISGIDPAFLPSSSSLSSSSSSAFSAFAQHHNHLKSADENDVDFSSEISQLGVLSHLTSICLADNRLVALGRLFPPMLIPKPLSSSSITTTMHAMMGSGSSSGSNLVHLDLTGNFITSVAPLPAIPTLRFLGLAGNCISSSFRLQDGFASLSVIDLQRNQLATAPDIDNLPALRVLLLDEQRISGASSSVSFRSSSLSALRIRDNQLTSCESLGKGSSAGASTASTTTTTSDAKSRTQSNASSTLLSPAYYHSFSLRTVSAVDLDGNRLDSLHEVLTSVFPNAVHVSVRRNKITTMDSLIVNPLLQTLRCCFNAIDDISALRGCRDLRRLYATHCGIRSVPAVPDWAASVIVLDLSNNRLRDEGIKGLASLRSLKALRLRGNLIKFEESVLKYAGFEGMPHLIEFDLRENPCHPAPSSAVNTAGAVDASFTTSMLNTSSVTTNTRLTSKGNNNKTLLPSETAARGGIVFVDDTPLFRLASCATTSKMGVESVNTDISSGPISSASAFLHQNLLTFPPPIDRATANAHGSRHHHHHSHDTSSYTTSGIGLETAESIREFASLLPPPAYEDTPERVIAWRLAIIRRLSPSLLALDGCVVTDGEKAAALSLRPFNDHNTMRHYSTSAIQVKSETAHIHASTVDNHRNNIATNNENYNSRDDALHQSSLSVRFAAHSTSSPSTSSANPWTGVNDDEYASTNGTGLLTNSALMNSQALGEVTGADMRVTPEQKKNVTFVPPKGGSIPSSSIVDVALGTRGDSSTWHPQPIPFSPVGGGYSKNENENTKAPARNTVETISGYPPVEEQQSRGRNSQQLSTLRRGAASDLSQSTQKKSSRSSSPRGTNRNENTVEKSSKSIEGSLANSWASRKSPATGGRKNNNRSSSSSSSNVGGEIAWERSLRPWLGTEVDPNAKVFDPPTLVSSSSNASGIRGRSPGGSRGTGTFSGAGAAAAAAAGFSAPRDSPYELPQNDQRRVPRVRTASPIISEAGRRSASPSLSKNVPYYRAGLSASAAAVMDELFYTQPPPPPAHSVNGDFTSTTTGMSFRSKSPVPSGSFFREHLTPPEVKLQQLAGTRMASLLFRSSEDGENAADYDDIGHNDDDDDDDDDQSRKQFSSSFMGGGLDQQQGFDDSQSISSRPAQHPDEPAHPAPIQRPRFSKAPPPSSSSVSKSLSNSNFMMANGFPNASSFDYGAPRRQRSDSSVSTDSLQDAMKTTTVMNQQQRGRMFLSEAPSPPSLGSRELPLMGSERTASLSPIPSRVNYNSMSSSIITTIAQYTQQPKPPQVQQILVQQQHQQPTMNQEPAPVTASSITLLPVASVEEQAPVNVIVKPAEQLVMETPVIIPAPALAPASIVAISVPVAIALPSAPAQPVTIPVTVQSNDRSSRLLLLSSGPDSLPGVPRAMNFERAVKATSFSQSWSLPQPATVLLPLPPPPFVPTSSNVELVAEIVQAKDVVSAPTPQQLPPLATTSSSTSAPPHVPPPIMSPAEVAALVHNIFDHEAAQLQANIARSLQQASQLNATAIAAATSDVANQAAAAATAAVATQIQNASFANNNNNSLDLSLAASSAATNMNNTSAFVAPVPARITMESGTQVSLLLDASTQADAPAYMYGVGGADTSAVLNVSDYGNNSSPRRTIETGTSIGTQASLFLDAGTQMEAAIIVAPDPVPTAPAPAPAPEALTSSALMLSAEIDLNASTVALTNLHEQELSKTKRLLQEATAASTAAASSAAAEATAAAAAVTAATEAFQASRLIETKRIEAASNAALKELTIAANDLRMAASALASAPAAIVKGVNDAAASAAAAAATAVQTKIGTVMDAAAASFSPLSPSSASIIPPIDIRDVDEDSVGGESPRAPEQPVSTKTISFAASSLSSSSAAAPPSLSANLTSSRSLPFMPSEFNHSLLMQQMMQQLSDGYGSMFGDVLKYDRAKLARSILAHETDDDVSTKASQVGYMVAALATSLDMAGEEMGSLQARLSSSATTDETAPSNTNASANTSAMSMSHLAAVAAANSAELFGMTFSPPGSSVSSTTGRERRSLSPSRASLLTSSVYGSGKPPWIPGGVAPVGIHKITGIPPLQALLAASALGSSTSNYSTSLMGGGGSGDTSVEPSIWSSTHYHSAGSISSTPFAMESASHQVGGGSFQQPNQSSSKPPRGRSSSSSSSSFLASRTSQERNRSSSPPVPALRNKQLNANGSNHHYSDTAQHHAAPTSSSIRRQRQVPNAAAAATTTSKRGNNGSDNEDVDANAPGVSRISWAPTVEIVKPEDDHEGKGTSSSSMGANSIEGILRPAYTPSQARAMRVSHEKVMGPHGNQDRVNNATATTRRRTSTVRGTAASGPSFPSAAASALSASRLGRRGGQSSSSQSRIRVSGDTVTGYGRRNMHDQHDEEVEEDDDDEGATAAIERVFAAALAADADRREHDRAFLLRRGNVMNKNSNNPHPSKNIPVDVLAASFVERNDQNGARSATVMPPAATTIATTTDEDVILKKSRRSTTGHKAAHPVVAPLIPAPAVLPRLALSPLPIARTGLTPALGRHFTAIIDDIDDAVRKLRFGR